MEPLTPLRAPGLNEKRCIARRALGYYTHLVVAATYSLPAPLASPSSAALALSGPLRACIAAHPALSTLILGSDSPVPQFMRVPRIDLASHVVCLSPAGTDTSAQEKITGALEHILNAQLDNSLPPWRIYLVPLPPAKTLVAFAYAHELGDGRSGLALHATFGSNIAAPPAASTVVSTPTTPLPDPIDQALSISWPFLLRALLPAWRRPSWSGTPHFAPSATAAATTTLSPALASFAKRQNLTLTPVLHILIAGALGAELGQTGYLRGATPIDLRALVRKSADEVGVYASTIDLAVPIVLLSQLEQVASAARSLGQRIRDAASRTRDQPVGLLPYVSDLGGWHRGKIDKARETSYELSNLGRADGEQVVFAQPGDVCGPAVSFNIVGGSEGVVVVASWQVGALGVHDERAFMERVLGRIRIGV